MKHRSSREVFAHWNTRRGPRDAADRRDIDPGAMPGALGDSFVLACDDGAEATFRLAGTRVCALFGRELRGTPFAGLWDSGCAGEVAALIEIAASETIGTVIGATGRCGDAAVECELLILPLTQNGRSGARLLGALAPLVPQPFGAEPLGPLQLRSHRHLGATIAPVAGRLSVPSVQTLPTRRHHGFVVYEGGRP